MSYILSCKANGSLRRRNLNSDEFLSRSQNILDVIAVAVYGLFLFVLQNAIIELVDQHRETHTGRQTENVCSEVN